MPPILFKALVTVLAFDVVIAAVSVPLILRRIPRNPVYGVRTRSTLSSDAIWYPANEYGGKALLVSSAVSAIGIVILIALDTSDPQTILSLSVACMAVPPLVAAVLTLRYASRLARPH